MRESSVVSTAGSDGSVSEHQMIAETWDGERLICYTCALGALAERLPRVERRPFAVMPSETTLPSTPPTVDEMSDEEVAALIIAEVEREEASAAEERSGTSQLPRVSPRAENPYYDLIVRLPDKQLKDEIPLGIVSKRYRLVQHAELLESIVDGLKAAQLSWESLRTDVRITEFGSRLHCTVHLPNTYREPVGQDQLDLTIEGVNSVDRSWAFRVGMGWMRLVCSNGLFVGRVTASMRSSHVEALRIDRVPGLIANGFKAASADATRWRQRQQVKVSMLALEPWADDVVAEKWSVLAAARIIHIARTGYDARFVDRRERTPASQRTLFPTQRVPGSDPPNDDLFRVGQILAWLANSPSEWGARLERRRQVPDLLASLTRQGRVPARSRSGRQLRG